MSKNFDEEGDFGSETQERDRTLHICIKNMHGEELEYTMKASDKVEDVIKKYREDNKLSTKQYSVVMLCTGKAAKPDDTLGTFANGLGSSDFDDGASTIAFHVTVRLVGGRKL